MTEADGCTVITYGNAKREDLHLASTIHCVDGEIVEWLHHREQRKRRIETKRGEYKS